jgi:adenylate cyclase
MNWLDRHSPKTWVLPQLLPLLIVLIGFVLMAWDPAPIQGMRNNLFDQYQRWQPRTYVEAPVRIIDIDEESLRRLGQWPWPRTRVADLIEILRGAGAAVVGFDVVFAEPDRTSPQAMSALWLDKSPLSAGATGPADGAALRDLLRNLPDHDQAMAKSLGGGGVVLGFTLGPVNSQTPNASGTGGPSIQPLALPAPYVLKGGDPQNALYRFGSVVPSLMAFQKVAAGNGVLTFVPDEDGVLRRVPLALRFGVQTVPSFTAELLRVSQGAGSTVLTSAESLGGGSVGLQEVRIGERVVPTTAQGESWVHYTLPQPSRYIPAWKVLANEVPADRLKGKMLLVGSSAQGLMDLRVSPLGKIIPGVEVHAQALEQMLSDQHLARPSWVQPAEIVLMLLVGLAVGVLALRARSVLAAGLTLMTVASVFSAGWLAFSQYQVLFSPLMPSLVVLTSFVLCSLVHHFMSEQQQRWLTEAFGRYVSPNKVAFLVKHPEGLELGGTRQMCSFIFTDLQGFTTLMENMDPGEAVTSLNAYLDGMVAIAFKHEGTLDRIMGDAVAVVFSAPVKQADHRQRALDCALEMHTFSKKYAVELQAKGVRFGNTRIGVHCGEVIVGNFGGSHMFDYRALGDPVNTAARLESVNKHLGTLFCMSEAIYNGCPEAVARPVGRLILKGKKVPLMVYEPVVAGDELTRVPLADYREAYALLAAQRVNGLAAEDGLRAFATLAQHYPADPLIRLHLERMQRGETGDEIVMADK